MNISVAIVDKDKEYVRRLSEELQQYAELSLHVYTGEESYRNAVERTRFDVVLFDPDISDLPLSFPEVKLPVCLYSDDASNAGKYADTVKIMKYQRISRIYQELIREYAEKAGYSADFDHSQNTTMIAVHSPLGGSGKTTVALAIASALTARGTSALFVSMERLGSSFCVNPKKEDGIVALIQAASDPVVNFELKLKGIMKQGLNGIFYVEGFDRFADYDAVTEEEIESVLMKMKRCGVVETVIVDMDSDMDMVAKTILRQADRIVELERIGSFPEAKMGLFIQQGIVNENKHKMVRVRNFAESSSRFSFEWDIPLAGTVHNYGNVQSKTVIDAISANGEIDLDTIMKR